jgi:hypothetical protein
MVLEPAGTSETEIVRVPLTLQLPKVPDLTSGIYLWVVDLGGLKAKIPFLLHGSDLDGQAEPELPNDPV